MEHMGFEPTASTMRMLRAPNCANAPFIEKNGSNGARTHDLSRVRRTLIPAELCFHKHYYTTIFGKINRKFHEEKSQLTLSSGIDKVEISIVRFAQKEALCI